MCAGDQIQFEAELRRIELILGLVFKADVIAWADEVIMRTGSPPYLIYDVSLAQNLPEDKLNDVLRRLAGNADKEAAHATAFRHLAQTLLDRLGSGSASADDVARRLKRAVFETCLRVPDDMAWECDLLDDEFQCVRQGILERESMEEKLRRFLIFCTTGSK